MSVCQLKGVQVNTSQSQADVFFTAGVRSGEQKAVLGTGSHKSHQFSLTNRELGSTQGHRTPVLLRAFPVKGRLIRREVSGVGEIR